MRRLIATLAGALLSAGALVLPAGAVATEKADVVGQGSGGAVVSADGATIQRSDNGISVKLRMPTPEPGSYTYPPTGNVFQPVAPYPGHPEAYSLWVFVFNNPADCNGACDTNDIGPNLPASAAVFNAAGHIVGGGTLTLSGHVSTTSEQFAGVGGLTNPMGADVMLAVAPHGALQPDALPNQITKPIGSPAMWWLAFFNS